MFRRHGATYRQAHAGTLGRARLRVMRAIELCRTAALGGHVEQCDACAHRRVAYNSCRNRHCPKCQALARALWLEARKADLLPVPCFHVVFTLPEPIAAIALQNKRLGVQFAETSDFPARNSRIIKALDFSVPGHPEADRIGKTIEKLLGSINGNRIGAGRAQQYSEPTSRRLGGLGNA